MEPTPERVSGGGPDHTDLADEAQACKDESEAQGLEPEVEAKDGTPTDGIRVAVRDDDAWMTAEELGGSKEFLDTYPDPLDVA